MDQLTIAIDIGNSSARLGLIDIARTLCLKRIACPTAEFGNRLPSLLVELCKDQAATPLEIKISSVVPGLRASLAPALHAAAGVSSVAWVAYHPQLPFGVHYENPSRLGPDRIADGLYGWHAFAGSDLCIIDAGTAITVDYFTAAEGFMGGAIIPGCGTQIRSLNANTAALPALEPTAVTTPGFPALSTDDCIVGGVRRTVAGGLGALVGQLRQKSAGKEFTVVTCGGEWPLLGPLVDFEYRHVPDCTLIGTGLF
jgi:type III pantothenate kinase